MIFSNATVKVAVYFIKTHVEWMLIHSIYSDQYMYSVHR